MIRCTAVVMLAVASQAQGLSWNDRMPAIQAQLAATFPDETCDRPAAIVRTGDINGDGVPEALVSFGLGGAYTSQLTLLRLENGKVMVARFKNSKGKASPMVFAEGASVRHSVSIKLLSREQALFSIEIDSNGSKVEGCTGQAYQWNPRTSTFDENRRLSKALTKSYCR